MLRSECEAFINDVKFLRDHAPEWLASKCARAYPDWEGLIDTPAVTGKKFHHKGTLFSVVQDHIFSVNWVPGEGTESLYCELPEYFAGTVDDPIPYNGNMVLEAGKIYTQGGAIYRGIRSSDIAVHEPLAVLATDAGGKFVEAIGR